ncbi:MAG: thiamine diphosphokinase [Pseudomonadota bacterium]
MEQNLVPDWVIGDFDSLPHSARQQIPASRRIEIAEQDTTDFEKCLTSVNAPLILAVGFTGARIDHQLAVFNALVRHPDRNCIVVGPEDVIFAAPTSLMLDCPPAMRVSLFALREMRAMSTGLRWPIDEVRFAGDGELGTSNEAMGPVVLEVDGPGMLVLLPRSALDLVIDALTRDR